MKLWLSKNSEVPVREQLITQITLGIASGELKIGDRLPSTREIARRFDVHPNTVGAAYKALAEQNLIAFKTGSGFYVKSIETNNSHGLESLISEFFESAKKLGYDEKQIVEKLKKRLASKPARGILVVESDTGLRDILTHEIETFAKLKASGISLEDFSSDPDRNAILAAMFDEKPKLDPVLLDSKRCVYLNGRSVASTMSGQSRPLPTDIVAVISGWDGFLAMARIMLLAAKIEPGNLIVRSTGEPGWKDLIKLAAFVICDSLTANLLPANTNARVFRIISDESIVEIQSVQAASAS